MSDSQSESDTIRISYAPIKTPLKTFNRCLLFDNRVMRPLTVAGAPSGHTAASWDTSYLLTGSDKWFLYFLVSFNYNHYAGMSRSQGAAGCVGTHGNRDLVGADGAIENNQNLLFFFSPLVGKVSEVVTG